MKGRKLSHRSVSLPHFMRSRWFIVGTLALLVLGSLALYGWWSKNSWDNYEKQYRSISEDIDNKLEATFSLQSDTGEEKRVKLAMLSMLHSSLVAKHDSLCSSGVLVAWQHIFEVYSAREKACNETKLSLNTFNLKLQETITYLHDEQALARHLAATPSQGEVGEAEFEAQLGTWRSVLEAVKSANGGGRFEVVKQSAIEATTDVIKNWEDVIVGHQAKDKTRYMQATQNLAAAFDRLDSIATKNTEQMTSISGSLKEAYANLK